MTNMRFLWIWSHSFTTSFWYAGAKYELMNIWSLFTRPTSNSHLCSSVLVILGGPNHTLFISKQDTIAFWETSSLRKNKWFLTIDSLGKIDLYIHMKLSNILLRRRLWSTQFSNHNERYIIHCKIHIGDLFSQNVFVTCCPILVPITSRWWHFTNKQVSDKNIGGYFHWH